MFLRRSLYRHITCDPSHRDLVYDGIKPSTSSWDTNKMSASSELIALCWNVMGGGAFLVWPSSQPGRLPSVPALITGHAGTVNDVVFDPFNPRRIASCSDDASVKIWTINEMPLENNVTEADLTLSGHSKRVGGIAFHPSIKNVLASFSNAGEVKIWDTKTGKVIREYQLESILTSLVWSPSGAYLAVTDKSKNLIILDSHTGVFINQFQAHESVRNVRICWISEDQFVTTGFSRSQERQIKAWKIDSSDPVFETTVDSASNILIPFYAPNQSLLYLFSKGASDLHVYELVDKKPFYYKINSFIPVSHQLSAVCENTSLDLEKSEIAKFYVASASKIETFTFAVPRKQPGFNPDFYPLGKQSIHSSLNVADFEQGINACRDYVSHDHEENAREHNETVEQVQEICENEPEVVAEESDEDDMTRLMKENEALKLRIAELEALLSIRQ